MEGWQYAIDHQEEAVSDTLKFSDKLNRNHEAQMLEVSVPYLKPDAAPIGSMDLAKWQEMERLLKEQGFLKIDVDPSATFTDRFLPKK